MPNAQVDADESKESPAPGLAVTAPPPSSGDSIAPASMTLPYGGLRAAGAGKTDIGRQRKHNEDHIVVRPELRLFVVADGMGGHNAGNVASRLVTTSISNFFEATKDAETDPDVEGELPFQARRLADAIRKANRDVHEISTTVPQHQGMGSTVVGFTFEPGDDPSRARLHVAHVGDSRCYRLRAGRIAQLTRDHSLVNDALELKPDLTEAELARLPKNIITRALGMKDSVQVDVKSVPAELGDLFLLCSDGLSGLVTDDQMEEACDIATDLQEVCDLLVAMANDAGGNDNISAILVRIEPDPDAPLPTLAIPTLPDSVRALLEAGEEVEIGDAVDAPADAVGDEDAPGLDLEAEGASIVADDPRTEDGDEPGQPPVICGGCGFLVPAEYNFCGECGKRVR